MSKKPKIPPKDLKDSPSSNSKEKALESLLTNAIDSFENSNLLDSIHDLKHLPEYPGLDEVAAPINLKKLVPSPLTKEIKITHSDSPPKKDVVKKEKDNKTSKPSIPIEKKPSSPFIPKTSTVSKQIETTAYSPKSTVDIRSAMKHIQDKFDDKKETLPQKKAASIIPKKQILKEKNPEILKTKKEKSTESIDKLKLKIDDKMDKKVQDRESAIKDLLNDKNKGQVL